MCESIEVSELRFCNRILGTLFFFLEFFVVARIDVMMITQRSEHNLGDIRSWYLNRIDLQFWRLWKVVEQHLCRIGYGSCIYDGDLRIDHVRGNAFV